ncbi:serine/threonine protein kinase, partial [Streptomyces sp. SID8455]|nr:serine/threonine protein kinase [Streptomyces sp. SID8455]
HPPAFPTPADASSNPYASNPYATPTVYPTASPAGSPPTSPSGSPTVSDDARRGRILRRTRMITTASSVVSAAVLAGVIL